MMFHIIYWISKKRQLITHKSRFFCWGPVFFSRGEISIVHRSCWQKRELPFMRHHPCCMTSLPLDARLQKNNLPTVKVSGIWRFFASQNRVRVVFGNLMFEVPDWQRTFVPQYLWMSHNHTWIYIHVIKITWNFHSGTLSCHLNELYWSMSWCFQNWGWEEWWRCGGPRPIRFLCQLILCFLFCKAIMSLTWNPGRSWGSFRWFSTSCLVQHCNGPRCWPQIAHLHSK